MTSSPPWCPCQSYHVAKLCDVWTLWILFLAVGSVLSPVPGSQYMITGIC